MGMTEGRVENRVKGATGKRKVKQQGSVPAGSGWNWEENSAEKSERVP